MPMACTLSLASRTIPITASWSAVLSSSAVSSNATRSSSSFTSWRSAERDLFLRRIEVWDHPDFAASTIAAVYRQRWQIELFFKALKQNLRIKTFVGTSANALQIQLWTALIALLVLKYLQLRARFGWSLSNLAALLRQQLFVYRELWEWIDQPFQPPPLLATAVVQIPLSWSSNLDSRNANLNP